MHTFSEITVLFEDFLKQQKLFPDYPKRLYEPCDYLLESGGKRIRPALCLMGQELFSELSDEAFHAATALELFHNFTLMHDDIMDKAPLRRGRPTVHVKYGLTTGILSGDALNIHAYRRLEHLKGDLLNKVFPIFNRTAVEVCEGQQLDFEFETQDDVSVNDYLKMIELKTSVLIAASLEIGAIIGGATMKQAEALYGFGKHMGIAFQLQDDYLDVFGKTEDTGKQPGGDILTGKKTMLFVHYCAGLNPVELKEFKELFYSNNENKVKTITELWRNAGVDKAVMNLVGEYTNKAISKLNASDLDSEKTRQMSDLFVQLMTRKS